ncbi:MAG: hypothetical protein Q4A52_03475 [Bacillota bacterium]|nr:hypothetical protein [Bacillota bacterium]
MTKEIDMLCWFDVEGTVTPIRFRLRDENSEPLILSVRRIVKRDLSKAAGNCVYIYHCEVILQKRLQIVELGYFVDENRWILTRIFS